MLKIMRSLFAMTLLVLSFTACGDDDDDNAGAGKDESDASVDVDVDVDLDADVNLDGVDQACKDGVESMADASESVLGAFGDGIDDVDSLIDKLDEFVAAAPKEIRADVKVVFDGYAEFLKVYGEAGIDFTSGDPPDEDAMQAISDAGEKLSTPEFEEASDNVTSWFTEHCGGANG